MSAFRAPGEDEYANSKFKPAAADTYRVRVDDYAILEGQESTSKYNPDGNPRVRFFLKPIEIDGDPEALMVDVDDDPITEEKSFIFFFDPDHLGTKPRLAKSRKFMAAVLNVPVEQPIEYMSLEAFCEDALNRELVVDVTVNGEYNNITDTRPSRRQTRRRVEKAPLVQVAEEVFFEDPVVTAVVLPAEEGY